MIANPFLKVIVFSISTFNRLSRLKSTIDSFLVLESHEHRAWSDKLVELLILKLVDLVLEQLLLSPVFSLDGISTLSEQVDNIGVLEGQSCHSNLDVLYWLVLKTEVGQLADPSLHLLLNPVLEALDARLEELALFSALVSVVLHFLVHEVFEEGWVKIELDREVTSSDSLDIPLDIVVLLHLLDVVQIVNDKERDEDGGTTKDESTLLPLHKVSKGQTAANLDEHLGAIREAWTVASESQWPAGVLIEVHERA